LDTHDSPASNTRIFFMFVSLVCRLHERFLNSDISIINFIQVQVNEQGKKPIKPGLVMPAFFRRQ